MSHLGHDRRHDDVTSTDLAAFESERPRLAAIATRILGSASDADDVLQEAWLRYARTDGIDNLPAWLTTVVTRLCLDQLRHRRARSAVDEVPPGEAPVADPEADAVLAERLGGAMQVVLDALAPAERAALVLHDVFGYPFDEISEVMGRSDTAVRQLASRARRKVQGLPEPIEEQIARAESHQVVDAFLKAARGGELTRLLTLLAPGAVMRSDAVAQSIGADSTYDGAAAVASRFNGTRGAVPASIDGELGAAWFEGGVVRVAFIFHVESSRVYEIEQVADPEVLATLDLVRIRSRS